MTNQTKRFAQKLGLTNTQISETNYFVQIGKPFILLAPTYDPETTSVINDFLEYRDNLGYCKGVVGSGNRNFADKFIYTAKDLVNDYHIPLLYAYEFNGTQEDVKNVLKIAKELDENESR